MQAAISLNPKAPREMQQIGRKFKRLSRQLPFATSLAVNDTAFDIRHSTVKLFNSSFQIRNKRFASTAFRVQRGNKRNLTARVYDRLGRDWLKRQAKGGTKKARGRSLLVPIEAKKTGRGTRPPRSYKNSFIGTVRGKKGVFQRYGRKGSKLRLLFLLKPSVKVPQRFDFYPNAKRVARRNFPHNYAKAWRRAVATARL